MRMVPPETDSSPATQAQQRLCRNRYAAHDGDKLPGSMTRVGLVERAAHISLAFVTPRTSRRTQKFIEMIYWSKWPPALVQQAVAAIKI